MIRSWWIPAFAGMTTILQYNFLCSGRMALQINSHGQGSQWAGKVSACTAKLLSGRRNPWANAQVILLWLRFPFQFRGLFIWAGLPTLG